MNRRALIVAVLLAAGCEQLKAPKRLKELEDRVTELSAQVETLHGGKPGAAKATRGDGHGSADPKATEGEHAGSDGEHAGSAAEGEPAAPGEGEHAGSDGEPAGSAVEGDHAAAEPMAGSDDSHAADSHAADDEKAGSADEKAGSADAQAATEPPADAGSAEDAPELNKTDQALADIAKLMASTRNKKDAAKPAAKSVKKGPAHWGYDAKTGPPVWGSLDPAWRACDQGKSQSPVDIEPKAGSASPVAFDYRALPATVIDNGHTLQVNFSRGNSIEIGDSTYQLVQLHFHTPSEHTIAGEHFPLEVHLVHRTASGRLAVIAVLYDAGAQTGALARVFAAWPRTVGVESKLAKPFDPSTLLPETRTVFRYTGSLTTPPCTEGVLWNVMRRTMTDTKSALDAFGRHYKINAREVWPLNSRKIE